MLTTKNCWFMLKLALLTIILTHSLYGFTLAQAQQAFTYESLTLTVYADGVVYVEYTLNVDPTYPRINLTLLGKNIENLIVVDEENSPLDFSFKNKEILIDTLGASMVKVSYTTSDLTNKTGRLWTLTAETPTNTTIILPVKATILSLNQIPIGIKSVDEQTTLLMPSGLQEIIYVIGVTGTKEYAKTLIEEAEKTIKKIENLNVVVTDAKLKLQEAKNAYKDKNYVQAEDLAVQAKNLAIQINKTASQAVTLIEEAKKLVAKAENEGRTLGLDRAKQILKNAEKAYEEGKYLEALKLAEDAKLEAEKATFPKEVEYPYLYIWILTVFAVVIAIVSILLLRRRVAPPPSLKEKRQIDLEKIFSENPQLRPDDREVLQYIVECGGEVFEAEIREKFKLPKTTVWRMINRLKKSEIVDVYKVGGQNLVRVKPRYELKR